MRKIKIVHILCLIMLISTLILGTYVFRDIQQTGEMYKKNMNNLRFDLIEANDMYLQMKKSNQLDNTYLQISAAKFSLYIRNVNLGSFTEDQLKLFTSLVSDINLLSKTGNSQDIEKVLAQISSLTKEVDAIKNKVNDTSNISWFLALN